LDIDNNLVSALIHDPKKGTLFMDEISEEYMVRESKDVVRPYLPSDGDFYHPRDGELVFWDENGKVNRVENYDVFHDIRTYKNSITGERMIRKGDFYYAERFERLSGTVRKNAPARIAAD